MWCAGLHSCTPPLFYPLTVPLGRRTLHTVSSVTLTQIAKSVGLSRQRVDQLYREDATFPDPIGKTANAAVWDEVEIRRWARRSGRKWVS